MFRNVGGKIRVVSLIFFGLMCLASAAGLVFGIISGVSLGWAWPIIGGVVGAAVGFVFSLISTYMLYGYGTLIKSCEENARTNAEILAFLRDNASNLCAARYDKAPVPAFAPAESIVEEPVIEKPVIETPVIETPVVEAPVVEMPIIEEPVIEEPIFEAPSVEFTFTEELAPEATDDSGEEKTLALPKNGEPLVKRCPSCGNVVRPQANFCNQCGHKMK